MRFLWRLRFGLVVTNTVASDYEFFKVLHFN